MRARWLGFSVFLVGLSVFLVVLVIPAAAAARRPAITVRVSASAKGRASVPLAAQTIAGKVYLVLGAPRSSKTVTLTLGRRRLGTVKARRGKFKPFQFKTTRFKDGDYALVVKFTQGRHRSTSASVIFAIYNHASAESLIASALALHRINYGTSLLYRMYASWHDDALPKAFRGSGAAPDDEGMLLASRVIAHHQVSAADARILQSFLDRPTMPGSIFSIGKQPARDAGGGCQTPAGWATTGGSQLRVWSQNPSDLAPLLNAAQALLSKEEADMGNPLPDTGSTATCAVGNPDSLIDIYLVDPTTSGQIRGKTYGKVAGVGGVTSADPGTGSSCSAFVTLNDQVVDPLSQSVNLEATLAHELYHLLTDAHNCFPGFWFREASAQWAEHHYAPDNSASELEGKSYFNVFQASQPFSLPNGLGYADWIWPLFMDQQGTNPAVAWKGPLAGVEGPTPGNRALDSAFPFADNFSTFALQDLQQPYTDQGSDEDKPTFQSAATNPVPWLPRTVPSSYVTPFNEPMSIDGTGGQTKTLQITMPSSLEFNYQTLDLPSRDDNVDDVEINLDGLPSSVTADALVRVEGKDHLELRKMDGGQLKFCRNDDGDNIDQIVLVLSNSSLDPAGPETMGTLKYITKPQCRQSGLSGNLKLTVSNPAQPHVNLTGNINIDEVRDPNGNFTDQGSSTFSGSIDDTVPYPNGTDTVSGSYKESAGQHPLLVEDINGTLHVYVILSAMGTTTTSGSGNAGGGACGGGASSQTDAINFSAGPYTIKLPPAGGAAKTIKISNTQPYQLLYTLGSPCIGPQNGETTTWSGSITYTPPK